MRPGNNKKKQVHYQDEIDQRGSINIKTWEDSDNNGGHTEQMSNIGSSMVLNNIGGAEPEKGDQIKTGSIEVECVPPMQDPSLHQVEPGVNLFGASTLAYKNSFNHNNNNKKTIVGSLRKDSMSSVNSKNCIEDA